jgi:allantoinase
MSLKAFLSRRVVTPNEIKAGVVLVQDGRILDVVPPEQLPAQISVKDFGGAALLPGLVDSHLHINEPGRTEWEGFRTATRAAAGGGCTFLVDMPLNCLPTMVTERDGSLFILFAKCVNAFDTLSLDRHFVAVAQP